MLNEPYDIFTFHSSNEASDIDVTVGKYTPAGSFELSWHIKDDVGLSNHNPIFIGVRKRGESNVRTAEIANRWVISNVDWMFYRDQIGEAVREQLREHLLDGNR